MSEFETSKSSSDAIVEKLFKQKMAVEVLKPANIVAEVKSLYEQYALPYTEDFEDFFTPDIPIQQESKDQTDNMFISHVYEQSLFVVMNRLSEKSMNLSVPILSFAAGKNPKILDHNHKAIEDDKEVWEARNLVEYLKYGYRRMVRDNADLINLAKYIHVGDNELVLDAVMLFYLKGDNPKADYLPITVDLTYPSDALETAISDFYESYGELPTAKKPSPIRFEGVEVEVNGSARPIEKADMPYFSGLFRELTTFDNDRDLGMRIQKQCQANPKLN